MSDMYEHIKRQADMVRSINLKDVLKHTESIPDDKDKAKWHTSRGIISITDAKFMNWNQGVGGGGAIDLVMHLKGFDFKTAVLWLVEIFSVTDNHTNVEKLSSSKNRFKSPQRFESRLHQIKEYLYKRCIPSEQINALIKSGNLYADKRGNAVFLLLGKEKSVVGAELRGTGMHQWRGMAPGSRKNRGCFFVKNQNSKNIVLCESAIDAISYFVLNPDCIAVSTSGVNANPAWLQDVSNRGYDVYCGFDADKTGDYFAARMMKQYPTVKRERPAIKDWNEVLQMKLL